MEFKVKLSKRNRVNRVLFGHSEGGGGTNSFIHLSISNFLKRIENKTGHNINKTAWIFSRHSLLCLLLSDFVGAEIYTLPSFGPQYSCGTIGCTGSVPGYVIYCKDMNTSNILEIQQLVKCEGYFQI